MEQKLSQSGKSGRGNKMTIQHYIRLFEPLVIKSLKLYTVTSSVELQVGDKLLLKMFAVTACGCCCHLSVGQSKPIKLMQK